MLHVAGEVGAARRPLERQVGDELAAQHLAFELAHRELAGCQGDSARALGIDMPSVERQLAKFDVELAFDAVERGKVEGVLGPYRLARGQRLGARAPRRTCLRSSARPSNPGIVALSMSSCAVTMAGPSLG